MGSTGPADQTNAMVHKPDYHTDSLEHCIRSRHSIRFYKEDVDVDQEILRECLALAQLAPSNSNIQNWRLTFASGPARDRVVKSLREEAGKHGPNVPPLPEKFKHFRSEFGHLLYGEQDYNIPRSDREAHKNATLRNYEFFGAPVVGVISMHQDLEHVDAMSVGMFVQTLMLALTERALGTCLQVSVTGYPEVVRREFGLAEDQHILCGMAVGWPAEGNRVNDLTIPRNELHRQVTFWRSNWQKAVTRWAFLYDDCFT
jgi:nitroreductase